MSSDALHLLIRFRLDAIALLVIALVGCLLAGRQLKRRQPPIELSRAVRKSAWGVPLVFAIIAEIAVWLQTGQPGADAPVVRLVVLAAGALITAFVFVHEIRVGALQRELQAHSDTERLLQQAKTEADEANRAKSDFLAVMSHEIRTPLNAVLGFANLLSESRLDEAQRGYVATIASEGTRLGTLINDILDLTKIEQGRLALERLPFAPAETVHDILRLLGARALERKVELRFEAQLVGPLLIAGDPLRFRQVLVNLIDNAIKFTPRGSVTVFMKWIPPAGPAAQGQLSLRVRDTGIGIAQEKLKDLFTMFMQADTSTTRRYGGTGLGLAICQRLVALMGGEITVTSRRGEGSEFAFSLPCTSIALASATEEVPEAPAPITARSYVPRILVVDDMETNRFLLEVFLQRNGFAPDLASGGEEAVRLASQNRYDAILMDLQMPDMDGYTATQRIRAMEAGGHRTPIIALTATATRGTREKCLAAGMDEHMAKPLDLRKFRTVLDTLLKQRDAEEKRDGAALPSSGP